MKKIMSILMISFLFLCLFASSFSVLAIGFDAETVYDSVFVINTDYSIGSGFAVGENSIITNAHVIDDARSISIETYSGETYPAAVYAADLNLDIALLVVEGGAFTPLCKGDINTARIGDDIYTIGAPKGLSYTLTTGAISAKSREFDGYNYIQIDAPINTGNSGGPLLDDNGHVLGINTLKLLDSEGLGLAIPIDSAISFLEKSGIEFDENGNIPFPLSAPDTPYIPESDNPDFSDFENIIPDNGSPAPSPTPEPETPQPSVIIENNRTELAILAVLFAVSFLVNIGLVAYITVRRKREKNTTPFVDEPVEIIIDPSERTDFEIEFME